jgi:hypothetical protein
VRRGRRPKSVARSRAACPLARTARRQASGPGS